MDALIKEEKINMKNSNLIFILAFLFNSHNTLSQCSAIDTFHFYNANEPSFDMEIHCDTMLYYNLSKTVYLYYKDSTTTDSKTINNYILRDSVVSERRYNCIGSIWKSFNNDSVKYKWLTCNWENYPDEYSFSADTFTLYINKNKKSIGCMYPGNISSFDYYLYNPKKYNIIVKYDGKKWIKVHNKFRRVYKFIYQYYSTDDYKKVNWEHYLFLDKKKLPIGFDEARFDTPFRESETNFEWRLKRFRK